MRVLFLLPLLTACAGSMSLVRPKLGKEKFYEVTTPHVVLVSDMASDDTEELGQWLEELWVSLADNYELVAPGEQRPTLPFHAIIFASCEDYKVFRPYEGAAAFVFVSLDYQQRPIIVGCRGDRENPSRLFLHELAHSFNHHFFPRVPVWLEEGLAQYYETLRIRAGKVTIGRMPILVQAYLRSTRPGAILVGRTGRLPTFAEIMAMTPAEFYGMAAGGGPSEHYAAAWVVVQLLNRNQQMQDRFVLYLRRLVVGQTLDEAWRAVYADVPAGTFPKEFSEYIEREDLEGWVSAYKRPKSPPAKVRKLRPGEVHALWVHLLLTRGEDVAAGKQLDAAETADPTWGGIPFWRAVASARFKGSDVDQLLRRAAEADPADRLSRLAMLRRAVGGEGGIQLEELDADAHLLEAGDASAIELATLAVFWTRRGDPARAMPFAARAVQRDRGCSFCYEAAAMTLASMKKGPQAVSFQERAIGLIERQEGGGDASAARERLAAYRAIRP